MPDEPRFLKDSPPDGPPSEERVVVTRALPQRPTPIKLVKFTSTIAKQFERAGWDRAATKLRVGTREEITSHCAIEVPESWGPAITMFDGALEWNWGDRNDEAFGDFELRAEPGLHRVPTLEEWVALRAEQVAGVIAAWREIRHPGGTAYEHLEVDALDDDRPITIVRALFAMPVCAVLTLWMTEALHEQRAVELAFAFSRLRIVHG
jgi:hypothetical protein